MKIVVLICVCMTRSILIDANKVVFTSCYNLFYVLIISLWVSMYSKMHYPYGGPQLSRQSKNLTAKPKTSLQKQKPRGKNKIPHDKTKTLTAKPKTSRQNQILHSKNQIPHGKSKYPRQNQSYFVFAVKYLVLP